MTLRSEWNPKSYCSPLFNMAAGASGIRIAESEIESITQVSNVVGRSNLRLFQLKVTRAVRAQKTPSMNFTADFQLHAQVQDFLEVQGRYVLSRILAGVPLDDHASY